MITRELREPLAKNAEEMKTAREAKDKEVFDSTAPQCNAMDTKIVITENVLTHEATQENIG